MPFNNSSIHDIEKPLQVNQEGEEDDLMEDKPLEKMYVLFIIGFIRSYTHFESLLSDCYIDNYK